MFPVLSTTTSSIVYAIHAIIPAQLVQTQPIHHASPAPLHRSEHSISTQVAVPAITTILMLVQIYANKSYVLPIAVHAHPTTTALAARLISIGHSIMGLVSVLLIQLI